MSQRSLSLSLGDEFLRICGGNRIQAAMAVALGLMLGDTPQHKAGYNLENAVLAAAESFDPPLTPAEIEVVGGRLRAKLRP